MSLWFCWVMDEWLKVIYPLIWHGSYRGFDICTTTYKNDINKPASEVSSQADNRSCLESACWLFDMLRESFFQCCSWPSGWYTRHNSGWRSYRETLGTAFGTGIQHMKQFAHNRYLPCCQCTETFRPYQHVIIIANWNSILNYRLRNGGHFVQRGRI